MRSPTTHFVVAIIIGFGVLFGYMAVYSTLSKESRIVANLQSKIININNTIINAVAVRVALTEIASYEDKVKSYFVSESGVVTFINTLEEIGQTQKASIKVLSVSSVGSYKHPSLHFVLSIKGTFDAVMRTIGAVEYAPYAISVTSLSVRKNTSKGWIANFGLSVGSLTKK